MRFEYDVIVVGGGHAGCEAAVAAARLGSRVLLVTMDMTKFANMSCNPAIGGVAKGQIVREIDALGGMTGIITDLSSVQFRMLNRSKGAAMWSPRAQCDKAAFSALWRTTIEGTDGLYIWQDAVTELITEPVGAGLLSSGDDIRPVGDEARSSDDGVTEPVYRVCGVKTRMGVEFMARAVVLTNGTFLNGLMHVGRSSTEGGRAGDEVSHGLTESLENLGFVSGRMKTGTPARIDARTLDFEQFEPQEGDAEPSKFSFLPTIEPVKEQLPCFLVHTNEQVHDTLKEGFADSPLFNGTIQGVGPRYCPSIEDKLRTFADKTSHQLFLEPEGRETNEYYLNGFSSSLPLDVQVRALQQIKGFENVQIYRPGYAIEYDYFPPTQLKHTLETFYAYDPQIHIILLLPQEQEAYWKQLCTEHDVRVPHKIAYGGETRFHSVRNGLDLIHAAGLVGVHDGVRPFVSTEVIARCYETAAMHKTAIPVVEVVETVRHLTAAGSETVNRNDYRLVQTPQVFDVSLLKKAYSQDYSLVFTDDASVVEAMGEVPITLVEGNRENIKITTPFDLKIATGLI